MNIGESKDRQETLYDLWTNILLFLFVASGVSTLVFGLLCVLSGFSLYKGIGLVEMCIRDRYIKSRIIMDRATCAGDYSEAEEYTNLMVGS